MNESLISSHISTSYISFSQNSSCLFLSLELLLPLFGSREPQKNVNQNRVLFQKKKEKEEKQKAKKWQHFWPFCNAPSFHYHWYHSKQFHKHPSFLSPSRFNLSPDLPSKTPQMLPLRLNAVVLPLIACCFLFSPSCLGIRSFPTSAAAAESGGPFHFAEAPDYRNGAGCPGSGSRVSVLSCDPSLVHIAMTLDSGYLRGSIAAVHSVLRHSSCPDNVFFHFIAAELDPASPRVLTRLVRSTFPSLNFNVYIFREDTVINLISSSIRQALENPLNYARNYLGDMLDPCVGRVIYLDSDIIVVDDIHKLWNVSLSETRVIGAPEYCHANFTKYFTDEFWLDPLLSRVFASRRACYFNTGVMIMDLVRWREGNYRKRIETWMELQKKKRIYELGSLPPFLLVFGGNVEGIDHRWNQHGLGGDNVNGVCRNLHPGPVSLLHWSGKGKPWVRLDAKNPCPLDRLWEPYDLYKPHHNIHNGAKEEEQPWSFSSSILVGYAHDLL